MNISQIAYEVRSGKQTATKLTTDALKKAKDSKSLNIFLEIYDDLALQRAKEIDDKVKNGEELGSLAGVPFVVKDNFLVHFGKTTAASKMLEHYEAPYTATAVKKLLDEDAVLIGKVNLDSFAHGGSTENSAFGATKNPLNPKRVPGGSSGGSAAAVAAGIVPFALGTDTGGSIRLPASFCGVVGFKPSYGLVSRYGVVAMASSTDCIGVLADNVENSEIVMKVIKGQDQFDGTTIDSSTIEFQDKHSKQKIGIISEFANFSLDKGARQSFETAIETLQKQGHEIIEVSIPSIELALACYYVIVPAEVSSNLSRYDGIIYGHSPVNSASLDEAILESRTSGFGDENKRRIMIGTYVLSSGYFDAYYKKAQRLRTKLIKEYETALEKVDALVSPVSPSTAFEFGSRTADPVKMYQADIMTVVANLVGAPAVSVPGDEVEGMPFGLQIMSGHGQDGLVLSIAKEFEVGIV